MSHGTSEAAAPVDHTEAHLRERAEKLTDLARFAFTAHADANRTLELLTLAHETTKATAAAAWQEYHAYRARVRSGA